MTGDGDLGGLARLNPEMDRSKALSSSSEDRKGVAGALLLRNCDASASKTASSSVDSLESSWKAEGGGVQASCWLGRVSSKQSCSTSVILERCGIFVVSLVRRPRAAVRAALLAAVQGYGEVTAEDAQQSNVVRGSCMSSGQFNSSLN